MIFFTVANQRNKRGETQFSAQGDFSNDAEAIIPIAQSAKIAARFFVGTCGYSYPGDPPNRRGGVFYPKVVKRPIDDLTFYATYFHSVEMNATFYRPPRAEIVQGWLKKTPLLRERRTVSDARKSPVELNPAWDPNKRQLTHPRPFSGSWRVNECGL